MNTPETISIDNVKYVRADSVPALKPNGNRMVVVVDRGWIFGGDVTKQEDGSIRIDRVVWLFRWESVGFTGAIDNPKSSKVTLKPMNQPVIVPANSVVFSVPVGPNWGLD